MALEEEHECEGGSDAAWMATFADLMSLLLTFFVLLLSFANMDVVRFKVAAGSVREAFGVQFKHPGDIPAKTTSLVELSKEESTSKIKIIDEIIMLEKVREFIKESGMEDIMEAELDERGVVIRIKGQILFDSANADLIAGASDALAPIVELTKTMPHQLSIQGHTDDRPIQTSQYPSNWELSTARAVAAMRYLVTEGLDPKRVNVAGYADMRPLADNGTAEGRAKNRRVEFVFLRSSKDEPITAEEIEATKRELERMRANDTLLHDPEKRDAGAVDALDAGVAPPDATPDARPVVAPDIRPNFGDGERTPVGDAAAVSPGAP